MRQNGEPKQTLLTPLPVSKKKNRTCTLYAKEIIQLLNLFFSFSFVLCAHCDGAWLTLIPFHSCNLLCIFFSLRSLVSHSLSPVCRYIYLFLLYAFCLLFAASYFLVCCGLFLFFPIFGELAYHNTQTNTRCRVLNCEISSSFFIPHWRKSRHENKNGGHGFVRARDVRREIVWMDFH